MKKKRKEDRMKRQRKCRKERRRGIRAKKQEGKNKMVLLPQPPKDMTTAEEPTFQFHIPGKASLFSAAVCTCCCQLLPELREGQKLK